MMKRIATVGTFLLISTVVVMLFGGTSPSLAQSTDATCLFLEIRASNDDSGIDPELKRLKKKLEKPPLSAWKSFKLVAKHEKSLTRMKEQEVDLQLGGKLSALLREKTAGKKTRFDLSVAIDNQKGTREVDTKASVAADQFLIFAYDASKESGNLLAFTCR